MNEKEFNELCAEFMDFIPKKFKKSDTTIIWCDAKHGLPVGELKFHDDWNWIMIVVDAIEKTYDDFHGYFSVQMVGNTCSIVGTKLRTSKENYHPAYYDSLTMDTKLESTVHVIYEFLLWKNMNYDNKTD